MEFHPLQIIKHIQNRIYEVRGLRVMLDSDLAILYEIPTKSLNLAVKRNPERFPEDFMFQLTSQELAGLRFQIETSNADQVDLQWLRTGRGGPRYLPFVFTEQGVAMLSGVLKSPKAIQMHLAIMRAFVEIRRILIRENDLRKQLEQIRERVGEHDAQLNQIYDALENLLDEKAAARKWEDRDRIGFR
jgi:hypothetical protein